MSTGPLTRRGWRNLAAQCENAATQMNQKAADKARCLRLLKLWSRRWQAFDRAAKVAGEMAGNK